MQIQRETSLRMLNKAQLATAENVESLRSQLVPGDPCPVCGSEDHPYAVHNPKLDHVLAQLESQHQENETAYNTWLQTESSLQETCRQLQKTINEQEAELVSKEIILQQLKNDWIKFSIYQECNTIPDDQKAVWLQQQILEKRSLQKSLHDQIQSYHKDNQQLDIQQQLIGKLDKQQNENSNSIKDVERTLQSLQEQLDQYNREQLKANNDLLETEKMLSPYFSVADWFSHWNGNPKKSVKQIKQFAIEWKENIQKLETDSHQYGVITATLKTMQEQSKTLLNEVDKKEKTLSGITTQINELTQKRKNIFNGEEVSTIETALKLSVDNARQTLERHKTDKEELQMETTRVAAQKKQGEKDIAAFQLQVTTYSEKIEQWLGIFNLQNNYRLDEDKLADLLSLEPEWIEKERSALRAVDDAVTQAQTIQNERTESLEQHERQRLS